MRRTRPRRGRVEFLSLPADPHAAFRERVDADRVAILDIAGVVRDSAGGARLDRPLARLEKLAHGLAGASGVFGYPGLSRSALRLERWIGRYGIGPAGPLSPRRKASVARLIDALLGEMPRD